MLDTNTCGQGAYLSFWVEEGRWFFSCLHLPLPPLIEPQLLRHSHPTLRLGALPEELSGVSKDFPIPHPQQAPEDLQTITPVSPCSWQLCSASALCWGEEERSWPGEGEAGCSGHYPSTAGASSLHEQAEIQHSWAKRRKASYWSSRVNATAPWDFGVKRFPVRLKPQCSQSVRALIITNCIVKVVVESTGSFPQAWVGFVSSTLSRCGLGRCSPLADHRMTVCPLHRPLGTARKIWGVGKTNLFCYIFGICMCYVGSITTDIFCSSLACFY